MTQRKFLLFNGETNIWWSFGEGTKNLKGDYYVDGKYLEASIYSLEDLLKRPDIYQEEEDPDLVMDEGL